MFRKIFALVCLLGLAGCPYTEGCEGVDVAPGDGGTADVGVDASDDVQPDAPPLGPILPNCKGLPAKCGGEDCCASSLVTGGTFNRDNDPAFPATVSDFKLDVFEVTVGRFRSF